MAPPRKKVQSKTESVTFSVDAAHINRLGLELVSRKETALSELIKNAYDADATRVDVVFRKPLRGKNELEISDNGSGMSRREVINGFLRISTDFKERSPISNLYQRPRAGRKGIGRFAAQRLAAHLQLETETERGRRYQIQIDWNRFQRNKDLSDVTFSLKTIAKTGTSGTLLRLTDLRDSWSNADIELAYAYTSEILEPAFLESIPQTFKVTIRRFDGNSVESIVEDSSPFLSFAAAVITGEVDEHGRATWSLTSKTLNLQIKDSIILDARIKPRTQPRVFTHLPKLSFKAYYFIKLAEFMPGRARKQAQEYLAKHGGVRVYRNGFRVLPYGESEDDWLGLDQLTKARVYLSPVSNDNWLGAVTISDLAGHYFQETSSREGLIRNDSFIELRDLLHQALVEAAQKVNERRGRKLLAGQQPPSSTAAVRSQVRAIMADLKLLSDPRAYKSTYSSNAETARIAARSLSRIEREYATITRQFIQENALLRILASIGLTVGEFTHEVRLLLARIKATTLTLKTKSRKPSEVLEVFEILNRTIGLLNSYIGYFDRLTSANYSRERRPIDVVAAVYDFKNSIEPVLDRSDIDIDIEVKAKAISVPMHESEWSSILINFMTNSIKAIGRTKHERGHILIRVSASDTMVRLEFEDDGDGIPQNRQEEVFNAFYTTSTFDPNGDLMEQNIGTGLGLKIVRDTVTAVGGRVSIVPATPPYRTCFHVEVPKGG